MFYTFSTKPLELHCHRKESYKEQQYDLNNLHKTSGCKDVLWNTYSFGVILHFSTSSRGLRVQVVGYFMLSN